MPSYHVIETDLETWVEPAEVFRRMFGTSSHAIWLDDALGSGFSIMADDAGPHAFAFDACFDSPLPSREKDEVGAVFDALIHTQRQFASAFADNATVTGPFTLGWLGWLGYEFGSVIQETAHHASRYPDVAMMMVDRALVFDHEAKTIRALTLGTVDDLVPAESWVRRVRVLLQFDAADECAAVLPGAQQHGLDTDRGVDTVGTPGVLNGDASGHTPVWRHERLEYLSMIEQAQSAIAAGECYQICLTNELRGTFAGDPFAAYLALRQSNPTSRSVFMRFNGVHVLSVSPEQFLSVSAAGELTVRPMKGTSARGIAVVQDELRRSELRRSAKEQAENLMIVDLMRNDLSKVAVPGSIRVSDLFQVESYRSVHQLVSTVQAQLSEECSVFDVIRAAFPGGSMTGAPKHRAMSMIDHLERGPRGIYSGAIGYIGLNGSADFSMLIRTAVIADGELSFGTGGGITASSVPEQEWQEVRLKAESAFAALGTRLPQDT